MPSSVLCTSTHECMNTHINPQTKKIKYSMKRIIFISQILCYLPGFSSGMVTRSIPRNQSCEEIHLFSEVIIFLLSGCWSFLFSGVYYRTHTPALLPLSMLSVPIDHEYFEVEGNMWTQKWDTILLFISGLQGSAVCSFIHCNIICKIVHKFHPRFYAISLL